MAGFTTGAPWLKVNPNYLELNAAAQENDPDSCLNYFRRLVRLRKEEPTLIYGQYTLLDKDNPHVFAYTRELAGKKLLILLNFKDKPATLKAARDWKRATPVLGNYASLSTNGHLQPFEAAIYELAG